MKKILMLMVFSVGLIVYANNGEATGTIEAFAEVLPDIKMELNPDAGADAGNISSNDGVLNFGTMTAGEERNTYDDSDGIGGTEAILTLKRPYKDATDTSLGLEEVILDFTLTDADGTLGVVNLSATGTWDDDENADTPEANKGMEADLIVSSDIDATIIVADTDTNIKDDSTESIVIAKMKKLSSGTYKITIPETDEAIGAGTLAKEVSPRVYVHGELTSDDIKVDGDYTGSVILTVKYSSDNIWMH